MAYLTKDAANTLFGYLEINKSTVTYIENTNDRGMLYTTRSGETAVIFIYPISHKADDSKNFFDTRDSGARERGIAWKYASEHGYKYFCFAVHDQVEKYTDYIFSLECNEARIAEVSGTVNGSRNGKGTQVVIPNDYIPSKAFDRILTKNNFYIAVIHRDGIKDYIDKYDNRPYMIEMEMPEYDEVDDLYWPSLEEYNPNLSTDDWKKYILEVELVHHPSPMKMLKALLEQGGEASCKQLSEIYGGSPSAYVGCAVNLGKRVKKYYELPACMDGDKERYFAIPFQGRMISEGMSENYSYRIRPELHEALQEIDLSEISPYYDETAYIPFEYETGLISEYPRNRILFGAPGTGKSYTVNREKESLLQIGGTYERVTFHPDYTYANFVGTYKPIPCKDSGNNDAITYEYVPGPFMRTLVKALRNSQEGVENLKPHLLIIEEINRANVAAVFGDVFQLLDRDYNEVSEYPIQASEDMKKYLAKELKVPVSECEEIKIPDNMFIWATMNSADQGVFPMDTAFKRRWDFTYLGINSSEDGIAGKKVILGTGEYRRIVEWNVLRKAINKELLKFKVNEDKLMGPYFISKKNLGEGTDIDATKFTRIFKNKVLMYLFDDAAKQKRPSLFAGCEEKNLYSAICDEFDEKGVHIFCEDIYNKFIDVPEEG